MNPQPASGRIHRAVTLAIVLFFSSLSVGCGGGGGSATPPPPPPPAPAPAVSSLSPSNVVAGSGALTLTVNGSNFVSGSTVQWNGSARTTTFVSITQLTAAIPASDTATGSTAQVTVQNPGAIASNAVTFAVNNPTPTVTSISPATVTAGDPAFTLTVNGSNFVSTSAVQWNGQSRSTTFVSSTQLTAQTTASDTAAAGVAQVLVVSPQPGGGSSNAASVAINNAVPTVASLAPNSATVGTSGVTVRVIGSGFTPTSVARWNGVGRVTTFSSATALDATIDATDLTMSGFAQVSVFNPPPGGGTSTALAFAIAPAPGTPGIIEEISLANDGSQPNGHSGQGAISASGRYVAFFSRATNLVQSDTNSADDVFVRDTCRGAPAGCVQSTIRVSVASDGSQGNDSSFAPRTSADGRFVLFSSVASNLVAGDTNAGQDVFLRDTCIGAQASCLPSTVRVSVASDGSQGSGPSYVGAMSPDGRFIAFSSDASDLVAGDTNSATDIFLRDTCLGVPVGCTRTTIRVSVADNGAQGNSASMALGFSTDGRFVTFSSTATNLLGSATNGQFQVFVRDTCTQAPQACQPQTLHASVTSSGIQGNQMNWLPVLSVNGRFVAFISRADNLVVGDTNGQIDAFWRDTCLGAAGCTFSTARVSVATDGSQGTGVVSLSNDSPWISSDGRYVAFSTTSSFGGPDTLSTTFLRDTCANASGCSPATTRIAVGNNPSLTPDIRFATIESFSRAIGQFVVSLAQTGLVPTASVPTINSLSPSSVSSGSSEFTLTLDGSGFDATPVVRWNGSDRPTIFVSKSRIQARIPASDLASVGSAQVTVFNPGTGGGTSNAVTFVVN